MNDLLSFDLALCPTGVFIMRARIALPIPIVWSSKWTLISQLGTYLHHTLRFLRLQLIPQVTNWRKGQEDAKVVLYVDRWTALLSSLVHLAPLATALALIILNIRTAFIGNVSTMTITALQFSAKLLEILMQTTITVILLGIVRQQVIAANAFPLGVSLRHIESLILPSYGLCNFGA